MKEIWKSIRGFEGKYEVSNLGNVRRGKKEVKQSCSVREYKRVRLNGMHHSIHRLVATAFIENPDNKELAVHKNRVLDDNRVQNLMWMTRKEVIRGTLTNGERTSNVRYNIGVKIFFQGKETIHKDYFAALDSVPIPAKHFVDLLTGHQQKTYKGYQARYMDDPKPGQGAKLGIKVLDTKTGKTYNSVLECQRQTGETLYKIRNHYRFKRGI